MRPPAPARGGLSGAEQRALCSNSLTYLSGSSPLSFSQVKPRIFAKPPAEDFAFGVSKQRDAEGAREGAWVFLLTTARTPPATRGVTGRRCLLPGAHCITRALSNPAAQCTRIQLCPELVPQSLYRPPPQSSFFQARAHGTARPPARSLALLQFAAATRSPRGKKEKKREPPEIKNKSCAIKRSRSHQSPSLAMLRCFFFHSVHEVGGAHAKPQQRPGSRLQGDEQARLVQVSESFPINAKSIVIFMRGRLLSQQSTQDSARLLSIDQFGRSPSSCQSFARLARLPPL